MIISVELVGIDGVSQRCEIAKVDRSLDGARLNDFGLSLEEAKEIERRLQQELTQSQTDQAGQRDRKCQDCTVRSIRSLACQVRVPRGAAVHGKHRDAVEWSSYPRVGAHPSRTGLPVVISRSSPCS